MSQAKHTPGDWMIDFDRTILALDKSGRIRFAIATVYSGGPGIDEADANARLMAAAPDLLKALRITQINAKHNRMDPDEPTARCWDTCSRCAIDAAIAKATSAAPANSGSDSPAGPANLPGGIL